MMAPMWGWRIKDLQRLFDLAEALAGLGPGHFGPRLVKGAEGDDGEGQGGHDDGHPHEGGTPAHQVAGDQHPAPGGDEAHPVGADADAVGHAQFIGVQKIDGVGVHRQVLGGRGQAQDPHQDPKGQGDGGVGHVGQAQHAEDDQNLGRHQPGGPGAEAVRQGTPQDLEAPGQAQEAQDADLLQRHPPAAEVVGQGGVDEPEGHPLGKVEDEDHQKFQVPGQVSRGLGGHG